MGCCDVVVLGQFLVGCRLGLGCNGFGLLDGVVFWEGEANAFGAIAFLVIALSIWWGYILFDSFCVFLSSVSRVLQLMRHALNSRRSLTAFEGLQPVREPCSISRHFLFPLHPYDPPLQFPEHFLLLEMVRCGERRTRCEPHVHGLREVLSCCSP